MEWTELKPDPTDALLEQARAELARQAAAGYLVRAGLRVLDRGWRCNEGTIDLLAAEQRVLVVCEIKVCSGRSRRPPAAISRGKARRLRRLGVAWLTAHGVLFDEIRIDIIQLAHEPTGQYAIEHVRGVA